jgi:hypothetical protein
MSDTGFACPKCDLIFTTAEDVARHLKNEHVDGSQTERARLWLAVYASIYSNVSNCLSGILTLIVYLFLYSNSIFIYQSIHCHLFIKWFSLYIAAKSPHPHQRIRYTKEIYKITLLWTMPKKAIATYFNLVEKLWSGWLRYISVIIW